MFKLIFLITLMLTQETIKIGNQEYEKNNEIIMLDTKNHDSSKINLKYIFYLLSDEKCSSCTQYYPLLQSLQREFKKLGKKVYVATVKSDDYVFGLHPDKDGIETFYFSMGNKTLKYTGKLDSKDISAFINFVLEDTFKQLKNEEEVLNYLKSRQENSSVFVFSGSVNSEEFKLIEEQRIIFDNFDLKILNNKDKNELLVYNNFENEENKVSFNLNWNFDNLKSFVQLNKYKKFAKLDKFRLGSILEERLNFVILFINKEFDPKYENFVNAINRLPKNSLYSFIEFSDQNSTEYLEMSTILNKFFNMPLISQEMIVIVETSKEQIEKSRVNVFNEYFNETEIFRYFKTHQLKYPENYNNELVKKHFDL